ncbi:MAG TPA: glycosyltransferase [Thermoanaerobaculia bacterium]|nr:glycosyltransferase [Thermoanaerobaculia bacterium]
MSTIVVATPDVVGARMAGPAIRAWHLAQELSRAAPTTLVAKLEGAPLAADGFAVIDRRSDTAAKALREAAVLVGQPARGLRKWRREQRAVFDMFDPTVLELRELYGSAPSIRQRIHLAAEWSRLCYALEMADLLISAAPQQRRFYAQLQSGDAPWIDVPFGIDLAETPSCARPQDNVVIWGGGVWAWLDPVTAIEAVHRVNAAGVRCKLLFLGRTRPNVELVDRRREDRFAQLLAGAGPDVSANAEWVPYRERLSWLRSGKVAIMLHRPTAEAEFSIRTRLFDAIAAGVPVVASAGGFAAGLVEREGLGVVVPPGDAGAVAAAIRRLLTDDVFHASCVQSLERIRPRYAWGVVARPLVEAVSAWLRQS